MIVLGGVILPDDLSFEPTAYSWTGIASSPDRSLGGNLLVWESEIQNGQPIDLIALENRGWLSKNIADQLLGLASVIGGTYTLDYRGNLYTVRFRQEDWPCLELYPIITRKEFDNDSYFYGKIKLSAL
jgi:hypothetical protein